MRLTPLLLCVNLCALAVRLHAPLRRTVPTSPLAAVDHLYAVGSTKRQREVTINGVRGVEWLCWKHIKGQPCSCSNAGSVGKPLM